VGGRQLIGRPTGVVHRSAALGGEARGSVATRTSDAGSGAGQDVVSASASAPIMVSAAAISRPSPPRMTDTQAANEPSVAMANSSMTAIDGLAIMTIQDSTTTIGPAIAIAAVVVPPPSLRQVIGVSSVLLDDA
jgi:hypothetical protein